MTYAQGFSLARPGPDWPGIDAAVAADGRRGGALGHAPAPGASVGGPIPHARRRQRRAGARARRRRPRRRPLRRRCSVRASRPKMPCRRQWCGPGRASTPSRPAALSPGCTGSPPTCASTCCRGPNGAPADGSRPVLHGRHAAARRLPENTWVQPVADARVLPTDGDPAELSPARDAPTRLRRRAPAPPASPARRADPARGAALAGQRGRRALDTSVVSVNSALQRAGHARCRRPRPTPPAVEPDQAELLARYVDAFERYDIESLVTLLHDDATFRCRLTRCGWRVPTRSRFLLGQGAGCRGHRILVTAANGCPAVGSYRAAGPGRYEPFAIQVIEISNGRISGLHNFLYPELFADPGRGRAAASRTRSTSSSRCARPSATPTRWSSTCRPARSWTPPG